jgi:hypothetical protein
LNNFRIGLGGIESTTGTLSQKEETTPKYKNKNKIEM